MKVRQVLSLTLVLALCLGLLPTAALAAETAVTVAIPFKYDWAGDFAEGFAAVKLNEKWGYIDKTGKEFVPCKYDWTGPFSEGLAAVKTGDKYGFIDKTGKEVVSCQYDSAEAFSSGVALVQKGQAYGLVDTKGKEIAPCQYQGIGYNEFEDGFLPVMRDNKWGFLNTDGKEVVPCQYDGVTNMTDGYAAVRTGAYGTSTWGIIDSSGTVVVPCQYEDIQLYPMSPSWTGFHDGLTALKKGGKWGYVNPSGQEVIPFQYENSTYFNHGIAPVQMTSEGKYGFIDTTGKLVVDYRYLSTGGDSAAADRYTTVASGATWLECKWGYIDETGKEVVPCKYDSQGKFYDGLAKVCVNDAEEIGAWGYVNENGQEVVPLKYDWAENFSEGLAAVELNGKWGFIDTAGKNVASCKYDQAGSFSKGLAAVMLNGKWGFIDKTGEEVVPCTYDEAYSFSEGLAAVCRDGKWGFISINASAPALTAQPSTQTVNVDGRNVEFAMYALNGGSVNYIRVRDLAALLNGTAAQFEVGWNGNVTLTSKSPYTGATDKAPFNTEIAYTVYGSPTYVDGKAVNLDAIQIEYQGGGFTYYKLRDLAQALGFNVGWSAERGVYVETDKPYDPTN